MIERPATSWVAIIGFLDVTRRREKLSKQAGDCCRTFPTAAERDRSAALEHDWSELSLTHQSWVFANDGFDILAHPIAPSNRARRALSSSAASPREPKSGNMTVGSVPRRANASCTTSPATK